MAETTATTQSPVLVPAEHAEPSAFGIQAGGWVAIAMLVVFAIALYMRVPALIAAMLDRKIDAIRDQLDNAAKLRAEAEALKAEYEAKSRDADAEIAALKESAGRQAEEIIAKAKEDATALIARHSSMAEEKIASAERAAVKEVRAKAAAIAAAAAEKLIADRHDPEADRAMVDKVISGMGRTH